MSSRDIMEIGDIGVVLAGTVNPYKVKHGIYGQDRVELLGLFFRGKGTPLHEFWFMPAVGGARKLTLEDRECVDQSEVDSCWDMDGKPVR